jgi:hypothetical protein
MRVLGNSLLICSALQHVIAHGSGSGRPGYWNSTLIVFADLFESASPQASDPVATYLQGTFLRDEAEAESAAWRFWQPS